MQGNMTFSYLTRCTHGITLDYTRKYMTFSHLTRCTHGITLDYVRKTTETQNFGDNVGS